MNGTVRAFRLIGCLIVKSVDGFHPDGNPFRFEIGLLDFHVSSFEGIEIDHLCTSFVSLFQAIRTDMDIAIMQASDFIIQILKIEPMATLQAFLLIQTFRAIATDIFHACDQCSCHHWTPSSYTKIAGLPLTGWYSFQTLPNFTGIKPLFHRSTAGWKGYVSFS